MYLVLDQEQDRRVRTELVKLTRERSRKNFEWYDENMPGLPKLNSAQRLAMYRSRTPEQWDAVAAKFPEVARKELLDYARLLRQEQ